MCPELSNGTPRGLQRGQPASRDTIGGWQSRVGRTAHGTKPGGTVHGAVNRLGAPDGLLRLRDLALRFRGTSLLFPKVWIRVLCIRLSAPSCGTSAPPRTRRTT